MKKTLEKGTKLRISASLDPDLIDYVVDEASKEARSFSDMLGRLVNEAMVSRKKKSKK
jgi:hypothetical protein